MEKEEKRKRGITQKWKNIKEQRESWKGKSIKVTRRSVMATRGSVPGDKKEKEKKELGERKDTRKFLTAFNIILIYLKIQVKKI